MENNCPIPKASLLKETGVVYLVQLVSVIALVQLAAPLGFQGALAALIGAIFVFLPVFVLDRRGKPYQRYGLYFTNIVRELPSVLLFILVSWPPIVVFIFLFPHLWQLDAASWQWLIPNGYFSILAAHFLIVALPEEFFFRGYLLGRLDDIFSKRVSLLGVSVGHGLWIQAVLFAVGHFCVEFNPSRLLVFFPALAFGYLRLKRNNITAPIVFHGCCNVFMDLFRAGFGL